MRGSLRDQLERPDLRLKRSRDQFQALVSPAGRSLGYAMTTESGMESNRPTMWVTSATFRSEGRKIPSVPLLTLCVTKDLWETAAVPCSRANLMDRNIWLGLLEAGEETMFPRAERRTLQDLRPLTQQGNPLEIGLTTAWSVERPSVWSPAWRSTSASTLGRSPTRVESVAAASVSQVRLKPTCAYTRVRSHTRARSAETASATWTVCANTGAHTPERNHTCVPSAGSAWAACNTSSTTSSSTPERGPAVAPSATAASRSLRRYANTSARTGRRAVTWELVPVMTRTQTPWTTLTISIQQLRPLRWGSGIGELRRTTAQLLTACRGWLKEKYRFKCLRSL